MPPVFAWWFWKLPPFGLSSSGVVGPRANGSGASAATIPNYADKRVLRLAEERLPLSAVATGPSDLLGFGPPFKVHGCLDMLVQEMRREGVFSGPLLAAALWSPVVPNRSMAVTALEQHPVLEWGPLVSEVVVQLAQQESDQQIRERVQVLAGRVK